VHQIIATLTAQARTPDQSRIFLYSVVDPSLRYELLSYNATRKTARLMGKEGEFEMKQFTHEKLQQMGYKLVREDELPQLTLAPMSAQAMEGAACGSKRCKGNLCPPDMWIKCPVKGGRFTIH
jgi:hypothetical protein